MQSWGGLANWLETFLFLAWIVGSSSVSPLQSPKLQDMSPKNSYRENLGQGRISKIGMGRYAGHHGNLNSQSKSFSRNSQASNFETNRYSVHVRILVEVRIGGNIERPASLPRSLDLEISLLVLIFDVVHLCLVWRVAFHETPAEKIKNWFEFLPAAAKLRRRYSNCLFHLNLINLVKPTSFWRLW